MAAQVLDGLVVLAGFVVLVGPGLAITIVNDGGAIGITLLVLGGIVYLVGSWLYAPFFMRRSGPHNGQTLGKQWMGIRAVRDDGSAFGWGWALLREVVVKQFALAAASSVASFLTFFLLGIGGFVPYLLDYLWPLWDEQNRAVHDMIVSTHVVKA